MKHSFIILKLGGSILTHKNKEHLRLREKNLRDSIKVLKKTLQKNPHEKIILIHGAGAEGHFLAHKYNLLYGTKNDTKKQLGALKTRFANQTLNTKILELFLEANLLVTTIHSSTILSTQEGRVSFLSHIPLDCALTQNLIPLLYGEMIYDETLGMSVCSGDLIAFLLAKKYNASRILFASDVDGVYTKDPYKNKDAEIIHTTTLSNLNAQKNIVLEGSHNIDVTGGLSNKIQTLQSYIHPGLEDVCIFNGLVPQNFSHIFDKKPQGTQIVCQ
jgi:isopentenyl phosphate kinase